MQSDRSSALRPGTSFYKHCPKKLGSALKWLPCALFFALNCSLAHAQAVVTANTLLESSLKAFAGSDISDVALTVTANFHPGSSNGSVQASLQAVSTGPVQITYETTPKPQVEVHTVDTNGVWSGAWKDANGTSHPLSQHNMMTEPAWFFPIFAIKRALSGTTPELSVQYIGKETFRGSATQHIRFVATSSSALLLQHLAQTDLYLDAGTLLPVAFVYNDHPDNNALLDIPVTVLFSDYSPIHGILLPTHVQQLRNNALFVDLRIQDIQINTHVSITPLQ